MPTAKPDTAARVSPSEPSTFASRRATREAAGEPPARPRNRTTLRAGLDAEPTPLVVRHVSA